MRALVVVLGLLAGCPAPRTPPPEEPEPSKGDPFDGDPNFKPKSFFVEVSGEGRPIIFIPGLGCPGEMWEKTVEHLGDDYQTHVLTLAGFAGRPKIPGNKLIGETVRKELIRYIHARKLKDPIIVGHSLGGFIAYWVGATAPDAVGGLVVVDAGPALSDTDEATAKSLRNIWNQSGDEDFQEQIRNLFNGMISDPKKLAPYMDAVAKSDRRAVGDAIYEVVTTDLRERVNEIRAPVLVVLADGGLQNQIKAQVAPIPDHEVVVVPGAHHFVMLDDPPKFYKVLDAFLAAHK
jgi:pimeloyl-ACP methyl ester carboxylesterase